MTIPRKGNNTFFLVSQFWLSKMYKEKYIYLKCNEKMEGGL